ncbi:DNA-binding protein [Crocosphaera sp. UHCC 0190]|uniref:DNA-binding protein n=1 Tax=Crocosphaera sp. UHCC 0190 TaxID=3110246 RepID=UPI002B1FC80C|nr:DNA-binding protein [Crocosphaera sp. UHCC 0190]MEA5508804.1 DNA-binding protein [Crocosphaera sp. UHCC 0190]
MASIKANIPDEQLQRLQKLAQENQISPEDLLSSSIEDWLNSPKKDCTEAANYVLKKNAELYRRLA